MTTLRDRPRHTTTWKRSRLLAGGAVVLIGAVWTGPQMAAAAPSKEKDRGNWATTTTSTSTTTAPAPSTVPPPAAPGAGGGPNAGGNGNGNSGGNSGGGSATPPSGGGTSPGNGHSGGQAGAPAGSGSAPAPAPASPPSSPPSAAPSVAGNLGGGQAASSPSKPTNVARPRPRATGVSGPVLPDVAVPPAASNGSALQSLQGPDRAAQATVRSINGGQSIPTQGGTALYAQLASNAGPLPIDDYPGNPYLVFVILVIFGIGIGLTGRRRHYLGAAA